MAKNYKITAYEQGWIQYDYLVEADSKEEAIELMRELEFQDSRMTGNVLPTGGETIIALDEGEYDIEEVDYSDEFPEEV
jgi:hypothetical protein